MKGNISRLGSMAMTMALATMGLFASCSSDDTVVGGGQGGVLTVSVTPSNSQGTRAATNLSGGDVSNTTENTINNVVVGVFNGDGSVLKIEEQTPSQATSASVSLTTSNLQSGDKVLVAVNVPTEKFDGVTTMSAFKATTLSIGEAIYSKANDHKVANNNNIPMYGESNISLKDGSQDYTASVDVYHMLSKVTLKSLKVNLTGATFQPTEIFLANVPSKVSFGDASKATTYTYPADLGTFVSGEQTGKATDYPYLSTEALTMDASTAGTATEYKDNLPIFYTMPNNKTAGEAGGATFLVIKGTYKEGENSETCYYPVYLNYNTTNNNKPDGGNVKEVHPNYNYVLNVVINRKGTDSPTKPVDMGTVTSTVTAKDFVSVEATSDTRGTRIGDYVFNDGTWGPLENISNDRYPIAVIFSNTPSATDIKAGYTHGYAMSLVAAGPSCPWATAGATGLNTQVQAKFLTDIAAIKSDYDGRTETNKVLALADAKADNYKNLKTLYPAFYYATRFGTADVGYNDNTQQSGETEGGSTACAAPKAKGTSDWYLGSIGQYYLVAKNLGGNMSDETDASWLTGETKYWYIGNNSSFANAAGVSDKITAAAKAMSDADVTAYTPNIIRCETGEGYTTWYWTSSEFSADRGFSVYWSVNGNFSLSGNDVKSTVRANNRGVRPVLAF